MARAVLLFVALAGAYDVEFAAPKRVASSAKGHLWRPRGGVEFGGSKVALILQAHGEACDCEGDDEAVPACKYGCGQAPRVVTTHDGGETFVEYEGEAGFCGAASLPTPAPAAEKKEKDAEKDEPAPEDDASKRLCVDTTQPHYADSEVTFPMVEWQLTAEGLTPRKLSMTERKVTVHTQVIKRDTPKSLRFGDNVLDVPDKALKYRLAELTYEGDEKTYAVVLKSLDKGFTWIHSGDLPGGLGQKNVLHRLSQNTLRLLTVEDGVVYQTKSKTLGRKWSNVTADADYLSLPVIKQTGFLSFVVGGRMGPVAISLGAKKGTEKMCNAPHSFDTTQYFNLVSQHNEALEDHEDYPEAFVERMGRGTSDSANCSQHPRTEEHGTDCASSGEVDLFVLGSPEKEDGALDRNYTDVMMCYDKLGDGWAGPAEGKDDSVYCVKARVNETAELAAHEAKLEKKRKLEKEKEEAYEKAKKMREEAEERKRQKKREKSRKLKEAKKMWKKVDYEANVVPAKAFEALDDELIIVRDLAKFPEYAEIMAEEVGLPDKDYVPDAAEEEAAKEE